jgi:hypothetical protein
MYLRNCWISSSRWRKLRQGYDATIMGAPTDIVSGERVKKLHAWLDATLKAVVKELEEEGCCQDATLR